MFHSANFWKIQIFIDSNFKLTTTCCYPYISLGSFSKLIHDNMSFGLWWVKLDLTPCPDPLFLHLWSLDVFVWGLSLSNLNDKWQLLTLKPHEEIPWMVKMMMLKASSSLPTVVFSGQCQPVQTTSCWWRISSDLPLSTYLSVWLEGNCSSLRKIWRWSIHGTSFYGFCVVLLTVF